MINAIRGCQDKIWYEYSLLRLTTDSRNIWMKDLGLHSCLINGEKVERKFPRLKYKRKLGSYCTIPYMPKRMIEELESKYREYYKEMLDVGI